MFSLQTLGATIQNLLSGKKTVDRIGLGQMLETVEYQVTTLLDTGLTVSNTSKLYDQLTQSSATTNGKKAHDAYALYRRTIKSQAAAAESRSFLLSVATALQVLLVDIHLVQHNFTAIFGKGGSSMPTEDLKVSHAVVLGYLDAARQISTWTLNLIQCLGLEKSDTVPGYVTSALASETENIGLLVTALCSRPRQVTIMIEINNLKTGAHDLYLTQDGATIDQYGHDANYSPAVQAGLRGFMRSPQRMIGDMIIRIQTERYNQAVTYRQWLQAKLALLNLQAAGTAPDSPQFAQLKKIIENFERQLVDFEERIRRYENG